MRTDRKLRLPVKGVGDITAGIDNGRWVVRLPNGARIPTTGPEVRDTMLRFARQYPGFDPATEVEIVGLPARGRRRYPMAGPASEPTHPALLASAIARVAAKVSGYIGGRAKPIEEVVRDLGGPVEARRFTENELRVLRHCLNFTLSRTEAGDAPVQPDSVAQRNGR